MLSENDSLSVFHRCFCCKSCHKFCIWCFAWYSHPMFYWLFLQVSCSVLFLRKQVIYGCVYLMHSLYNFLTMAIAYQIPCGFWTVILHATCLVMLLSAYYVRYVSDSSISALSYPNLRQKCVSNNCKVFAKNGLKGRIRSL